MGAPMPRGTSAGATTLARSARHRGPTAPLRFREGRAAESVSRDPWQARARATRSGACRENSALNMVRRQLRSVVVIDVVVAAAVPSIRFGNAIGPDTTR